MKNLMAALVLGLSLMGWAGIAKAAPDWYVVTVSATGSADSGQMFVRLSDTAGSPAFTNKWFMASAGVEKEMLAVALSGMVADINLWVRTDPADGSVPVLLRCYLRNF